MNNKIQLYYAISNLADVVIENEGAFGMTFGGISFEARGKCGNTLAYPKKPISQWTDENGIKVLEDLRSYFMDALGVKDEY